MFQGEHSAIHSAFIKLPFVINIFVLSFLGGPFTQVLLLIHFVAIVELVTTKTISPHKIYLHTKTITLKEFLLCLYTFTTIT